MFKQVCFHGTLNERTGYGIHATRLCEQLSKLIPVSVEGEGDVHLSLLDVVTASQATQFPPSPSILMTVWESTCYPDSFISNLKNYDQLWLVSEWEKSCAIAQGIPEEFIKVVPEGVDEEIYKPMVVIDEDLNPFIFLHIGQWQPRKSTLEICQAFLKAFPDHPGVRLYLSADTLFPSDTFSSTEERLSANGINDPRIIPVHFEERDAYVRRLQSAHCFVSCARSEGWNLPLSEALACGIPSICSDFGGSTEYAGEAITVRIRELRKPVGIFGGWDVPGQWGEPDYDDLAAKMRMVYDDYANQKSHALVLSDHIRSKFSWSAAAKKAYDTLEELSKVEITPVPTPYIPPPPTPEDEIRQFAASRGYIIPSMTKRSAIFEVECWPDTPAKMETLKETIDQISHTGFPVLLSTHYPLPPEVISLADFYIYEKADRMSGDDHPIYWRVLPDGTTETKRATVEYQGCAALNCFRNSIDFCRGRYDWIYQMNADMEVDLDEWLRLVHASSKSMVCIPYEGRKDGIGGGLWAGKVSMLDRCLPHLSSWQQYADMYPDVRFVVERWLYNHIKKELGDDFDNIVEWITIPTTNRFDNVDRTLWGDQFICHFIEGPFLQIIGNPANEYDVTWSFPGQPTYFCLKQKGGTWSRPEIKYHRDWTVTASLNGEVKFTHTLDLTGKRVMISMGSKALGDTLAWIPYVEEFRKRHNCHVVVSGWWMDIMDYPEIEFTIPGSTIDNLYASYDIGCFDDQLDRNKVNWRLTPLQQVAADILGLDYVPLKAKLKADFPTPLRPKYICFSEFSTMQNKLWNNPGAWQKVIDYCVSLGYDCVSISTEPTQLLNVTSHNGQPIESTISDIAGADFYIGLNHGPYWIAYSLGIPAIMIDGVAEAWNNPPNPYRIQSDECHPGCFNDPSLPINRGWEWCPREKDYACTRSITPEQVIKVVDELIETCRITPDEV